MEAEGESSQQLWSPPTTLLIHVRRRHGRTSPIFNPEALILAIPILVLLIIFLVLPLFFSYANHQILKPSLVQKGWDSINIFLVLIAVLCGVFAKRNDDNSSSLDAGGEKNLDSVTDVSDDNIRKSIASSKWLDFPDKSEYDKMTSSRSYPDLRQESLWGCESNRFKCFDDFEVNFHRQPEQLYHRERRSQKVEREAAAEPAPPVRRRRSVHRGRNDEKNENKSPPPPAAQSLPPPPPPPREPEFIPPVAEKAESIQRENGGATKEIATAIASLQYGTQTQRKKKVKPREIYESPSEDSLPPSEPAPPSPPPPSKGLQSLLKKSSKSKHVHSVSTTAQPPPPPPPLPNSIFANIFKTGSKSMRSQLSSASSQPPPPPPPPPYSILNNIFSSGSKSKRCQIPSASSHPLPPPPTSSTLIPSFENLTRSRRFKNSDTPTPPLPPPPPPPGICPLYTGKPPKPNTSSHNETAIIVPPSPPPPPPPPPFRTPEINFVPNRDLARNRSTSSSQRSSPEVKNVHVMTIGSDSGHSIRPSVSCPSPDVNIKADTFISRLRDGWRLEKLNSINERQNSVSSTSNRL